MLPAEELRRANEQLLLSSLREQASAEEARAAKRELEQVLRRMSLLADASALLSASLQSSVILGSITKLIVAELADCSVIQLIKDGAVEQLELAHKDPRLAEQLSRLGVGLAQDVELRRMLKLALFCGVGDARDNRRDRDGRTRGDSNKDKDAERYVVLIHSFGCLCEQCKR